MPVSFTWLKIRSWNLKHTNDCKKRERERDDFDVIRFLYRVSSCIKWTNIYKKRYNCWQKEKLQKFFGSLFRKSFLFFHSFQYTQFCVRVWVYRKRFRPLFTSSSDLSFEWRTIIKYILAEQNDQTNGRPNWCLQKENELQQKKKRK